ncbi:ABC transporter ATP-binding protein [Sneathiella limimaris]|uniref:ABC transporter ATP-binding protein n=1 Tax=Sneathiella limimaris TaxID=1964213 RepID=UPI00146EE810|nr:ABC transporter ATP-binding protein [Sneathiella limimaris]
MVVDDTTLANLAAMKDTETSADEAPSIFLSFPKLRYGNSVILTDFSLKLEAGKTTCLLGPSGVGKTTILKSIAGLLPLDEGAFVTADDEKPLKGRISYMPQNDLLLPWATALENMSVSSQLKGSVFPKSEALNLLNQVGLKDKVYEKPGKLSGGMRQRLSLARTLLEEAPVLLADEPFSALDAITRHRLQSLFSELTRNKTVLMVTHDPMEASRLGDYVYVLGGEPVELSQIESLPGYPPRNINDPELLTPQSKILSLLGMTEEQA